MGRKLSLDVLVVEDEVDTRSLLSQIFMQRGHKVRTAEDGFAALALIRKSSPDLILSDLNMPGMTGFEFLSIVRRLYPHIYVIASSGAYTGTGVPRGIAADGFHAKATGIASLIELMEQGVIHIGTAARVPIPQWVSPNEDQPGAAWHVFINCPDCLRPFRQNVERLNAEIREASCRYCGGRVEFALALPVKPAAPARRRAPRPAPPVRSDSQVRDGSLPPPAAPSRGPESSPPRASPHRNHRISILRDALQVGLRHPRRNSLTHLAAGVIVELIWCSGRRCKSVTTP